MTTSIQLEALFRCYRRIGECEGMEAGLGPNFDPKVRAANDRDRDRAFIALRRAMKALKELRSEVAAEPTPVEEETPIPALPQIARNASCPCGSGDKYKRCCGRHAPPLPGNFGHGTRPNIAPTGS